MTQPIKNHKPRKPAREKGKWDHLRPVPQAEVLNVGIEQIVHAVVHGEDYAFASGKPSTYATVYEQAPSGLVRVGTWFPQFEELRLHPTVNSALARIGANPRAFLQALLALKREDGEAVLAYGPTMNNGTTHIDAVPVAAQVDAVYAAASALIYGEKGVQYAG